MNLMDSSSKDTLSSRSINFLIFSFSSYILEIASQKIVETGYFEEETIYCPFE